LASHCLLSAQLRSPGCWLPGRTGQKGGRQLKSATSELRAANRLIETGTKELAVLLRTLVQQASACLLIVNDGGECQEASAGATKLLRLSRQEIVGGRIEFGRESVATFTRLGLETAESRLLYTARAPVLPGWTLLVLREDGQHEHPQAPDYALSVLDREGRIVAWYEGAERVYGYQRSEILGQSSALFHLSEDVPAVNFKEQLERAVTQGHTCSEGWQCKKIGSKFWTNSLVAALKDDIGTLIGFSSLVRDFSQRHKQDEKLQRNARQRSSPTKSAIAGIVSGEFDRIAEANDVFLELVGYSREDLQAGLLRWTDLGASESLATDELAYEEGLRFGACTPFEKELIGKEGARVPVLIAMAVLKLSPFRWIAFVQDLRERERLEAVEGPGAAGQNNFEEMIGDSAPMKRVTAQIDVVAPTDATVLILGETGTGKELVARAVHRMSPRRNFPFISLNCAAIPTGLLESELFGYERGAFTGALAQKIGRFEMAHRGTLFLDEVGDIPLDLQPKLLRALQEKSFERLGGTKTIPIDVRLVAATNRNLTQMMGDKLFRSDLYYRLKVFPITTPPLRDHPEDIPALARHFTKKYAAKMDRQIEKIPADTMQALIHFRWPGNVRELENFIERAVILSRGPNLRAPLAEIREEASLGSGSATLKQVEREHILRVLRESGGVVTTAAARLGLQRTTLNAMMRKLGIFRKDL